MGARPCSPTPSATGASAAAHAIEELDPENLDVAAVLSLVERYGDDQMKANLDRIGEYLGRRPGRPAQLDEFAAAGITVVDDLLEPFEERMFFGCEADDPLVGLAFDASTSRARRPGCGRCSAPTSPTGTSPVMSDVMVEAYELLEHGLVDAEQFRDFTFANAVRMHGGANPAFFEGTVIEAEAAAVLRADYLTHSLGSVAVRGAWSHSWQPVEGPGPVAAPPRWWVWTPAAHHSRASASRATSFSGASTMRTATMRPSGPGLHRPHHRWPRRGCG